MKTFEEYWNEEVASSKNTARPRTELSPAIVDWLSRGVFKDAKTILDFGAGRGENAEFLKKKLPEAEITAYEPHPHNNLVISKYSELEKNYDLVYSTYVLNVVPPEVQETIVKQMLKKSSKIIIAVRDDLVAEMKKMKQYADLSKEERKKIAIEGYSTGKDKFQRLVTEIPGFTEKYSKPGSYRCFVKGVD